MTSIADIPEDFDHFLMWLKRETEAAWAVYRTKTFEEFEMGGVGGGSWRTGTKWQPGLEEGEIREIEARWNVRFPTDYRRFLAVLNAPDRRRYSVGWSNEPPYSMREGEDESSYFDWRRDDADIAYAFEWTLRGLLFDVENDDLWMESWARRPDTENGRKAQLSAVYADAPPLNPVFGHRFMLAQTLEAGNPMLSIWQADIIFYGANLRNFLLLEFSGLLGLDFAEIKEFANEGITRETIAGIPFWGELILRNARPAGHT